MTFSDISHDVIQIVNHFFVCQLSKWYEEELVLGPMKTLSGVQTSRLQIVETEAVPAVLWVLLNCKFCKNLVVELKILKNVCCWNWKELLGYNYFRSIIEKHCWAAMLCQDSLQRKLVRNIKTRSMFSFTTIGSVVFLKSPTLEWQPSNDIISLEPKLNKIQQNAHWLKFWSIYEKNRNIMNKIWHLSEK